MVLLCLSLCKIFVLFIMDLFVLRLKKLLHKNIIYLDCWVVLKPFIFCTWGEHLTSSGLQGRGGSWKASVAAQVRAMAAWVRFWKWSCGRLWKGQTDLTVLVAALQLLLAVKILTCGFLPFAFCSREKGCQFRFRVTVSWKLTFDIPYSFFT